MSDNLISCEGRGGITATMVKDSVSVVSGVRLTTMRLVYPRFIHAEFLTHRSFSRNSSSSRAQPSASVLEYMDSHGIAMPIEWGQNCSGMQAKEELDFESKRVAMSAWAKAAADATMNHKEMAATKAHKQIANRISEPYQFMTTVVSSTEWSNFFALRNHTDAQPEIQELAKAMQDVFEKSKPEPLGIMANEWHTPFILTKRGELGNLLYFHPESGEEISDEDARMISISCCAQESYRKNDTSLEKAKSMYARLYESKPPHMSPFEHVATPMSAYMWRERLNASHLIGDQIAQFSGNFRGWVQFRKTLKGECQ